MFRKALCCFISELTAFHNSRYLNLF